MDRHVPGQLDEYVGRIAGAASLAHAGAAFLLLVWPAFAEQQQKEENPITDGDGDDG
jgi:hypothetical protein